MISVSLSVAAWMAGWIADPVVVSLSSKCRFSREALELVGRIGTYLKEITKVQEANDDIVWPILTKMFPESANETSAK